MDAEFILSQLEDAQGPFTIDRPILTPPPEYSSFYWKNSNGIKYKAFLPTKKKKYYYYNLEEYNSDDIDPCSIDENWRKAKKCVQIAVSNNPNDQPIIESMDRIIDELHRRMKAILFEPSEPRKTTRNRNLKHYVFYKYLVDDILHIDMKERYKHAKCKIEIDISQDDEDRELLNAIDSAFKTVAQRFYGNKKRKVLCYSPYNFHVY